MGPDLNRPGARVARGEDSTDGVRISPQLFEAGLGVGEAGRAAWQMDGVGEKKRNHARMRLRSVIWS
jgi:hypothetical protein